MPYEKVPFFTNRNLTGVADVVKAFPKYPRGTSKLRVERCHVRCAAPISGSVGPVARVACVSAGISGGIAAGIAAGVAGSVAGTSVASRIRRCVAGGISCFSPLLLLGSGIILYTRPITICMLVLCCMCISQHWYA